MQIYQIFIKILSYPCFFIPLPHYPRITPLAHLDLLLRTPEDRYSFAANITPVHWDLHPDKVPVVQEPGERVHPERLLTLRTFFSSLHIFAQAGGERRTIVQARTGDQGLLCACGRCVLTTSWDARTGRTLTRLRHRVLRSW